MNAAEHKAQAEALIDRAMHFIYGDGADVPTGHALAAVAQVHATLAGLMEPPVYSFGEGIAVRIDGKPITGTVHEFPKDRA